MSADVRNDRDDLGKLILRITVGALLTFHGIRKILTGIAWMHGPLAALHLPFFVGYGVYVGEVVAPILIVFGLLTRPAALIVVVDLVMAIVLVAWHRLFALSQSGGYALEAEAFYLLLGIVLFLQGPGRFSVSRGRGFWA